MATNPTVLYFGIYDSSYARNWVLINGLKENGVKVLECNVSPRGRFSKFARLFFKYWKLKDKYDVMIVGFPGQEAMFLARFLISRLFSRQARKPIIFDAFTSHYGGYILDRKKYGTKSFHAKWYRFLDKWSCKLADLVLLDTNTHIDFFVKEYKLPREKFRRIWIGANDQIFQPKNNVQKTDNLFRVIFFGTFVPLQGAEYIIMAAKILEAEKDIIFYFIGKGQDKPKSIDLAGELKLKNIEFLDTMKPEDLKAKLSESDIALGLFGDTPKTPLVIPNKVYESLAMRKPIITADTKAIRELFDENDMYLVKTADSKDLARAIIELKNNPGLRNKLAENGYKKFKENASHKVLGGRLLEIINEIKKT